MLYVDAFGYARKGISGALGIDAVTGIVASVLLGALLFSLGRKSKSFSRLKLTPQG
jgi:high-affinity Fe2+/Pb2+ permease